jgi:hypothetical protein
MLLGLGGMGLHRVALRSAKLQKVSTEKLARYASHMCGRRIWLTRTFGLDAGTNGKGRPRRNDPFMLSNRSKRDGQPAVATEGKGWRT